MTALWLTQVNSYSPAEIIGIFSTPQRAKEACQDIANEYMGEASTPPLTWLGEEKTDALGTPFGHYSASHYHPGLGSMQRFQTIRYELDQVAL